MRDPFASSSKARSTAGATQVGPRSTTRSATAPSSWRQKETRRFAGVPDIFSDGIHSDLPAYAIARTRRVWGSLGPNLRLVFGWNPPVEDSDDPQIKRSLQDDGVEREAWPAEPAWKL